MSLWEKLALAGVALLIIFWVFPGIKPAMERSKDVPQDWKGLLLPIAGVVLFVLFLVISVKG